MRRHFAHDPTYRRHFVLEIFAMRAELRKRKQVEAVTNALLPKYPMECDEGWRSIVDPLIAYCREHNITILQIKEKFGGLRFYVAPFDPILDSMITEAEGKSLLTCEKCGAPGKPRHGGWIKTLCDEHAR